ncbi:MAG: hypothetical protein K0U20_09080 [Proteobacteria bacterium]|nr:hypothetical protein [Pseudomonadota bacterium]
MLKAAVVIDAWKLSIFKNILDDAGFEYTEHKGPGKKLITLQVQTETAEKLKPHVIKATNIANRRKYN